MRRILIDTNVILDSLLDRMPFADTAERLWDASDRGVFDGYIASFAIPTIYYVCEKIQGHASALRAVDFCLESFDTAATYRECIVAARRMTGVDFEDNLQIACAITDFMQGIVTRNAQDFTASPIKVYSPDELLAEIQS